ncbi:MAG: RNA-binding S4 domain-containing protein [Undibacterium sp.]|nr:RNA-binding S4 domain-containing protein [Opitutaceae bacterium]
MSKPNKTKDGGGENTEPTVVIVREEPIEMCQLLKFAGLTDSGGEAKQVIAEGKVLFNGVVETQKRKKVRAGDRVTYGDETLIVKVGG